MAEASKKAKKYKAVMKLGEGKRPVFGGAFNTVDKKHADLFATVSGNHVSVYSCTVGSEIRVKHLFVDENRDEVFYTLAWLCGPLAQPWLAASGSCGVIRVIDIFNQQLLMTLSGHGGAVNELCAHTLQPSLLLSASKDESLRLWNVHTGVCVAVFGGANGHRNEVLSADFHPSDRCLVASCGMDSVIRVWSLRDHWDVVDLSYSWSPSRSAAHSFPTRTVQYPVFTVTDVHTNYIDCLRWCGDFFLSKSVDNEVLLWRWCSFPQPPSPNDQTNKKSSSGEQQKQQLQQHYSPNTTDGCIDILLRYEVPDCDIWFIKFDIDFDANLMAIGNREGKVLVWDLHSCPPQKICVLNNKACKVPVRQTAISRDGRTIMCCCDDGSVWQWEKVSLQP